MTTSCKGHESYVDRTGSLRRWESEAQQRWQLFDLRNVKTSSRTVWANALSSCIEFCRIGAQA